MSAMTLGDLAAAEPSARLSGDPSTPVVALAYDSREVVPGSLFAAIPGTEVDGHRFIPQALAAGAVAVIAERAPERALPPGVALLLVEDSRRALARVAAVFHGQPTSRMVTVGVTGTNGKTTITYLLEAILERAGMVVGTVGTIGVRLSGRARPATHTTPEGPDLQRILAEMVRSGAGAAVMEISSHALQQGRATACQLDIAAFTNLTRDHLDFHGDMESYLAAKLRIVDELLAESPKPERTLVVNGDDPLAERFAERWPRAVRVSAVAGAPADVAPLEARFDLAGIHAVLRTPSGDVTVESPLLGAFNLSNIAVATAVAHTLRVDPAAIAGGLRAVRRIPGRLEPVTWVRPDDPGRNEPRVLVDYAHTPDALRRVLEALRPLVPGRLWVVFGCGGDRDRGKRGPMGRAAARGADALVVTSDNPRSEDPVAIVDQIVAGAREAGGAPHVEPDRRAAIEHAVAAATPDDLVLIAGKGHERVQIIGDREAPFADQEVARDALRRRAGA